jgi:hypothetical protein
MDGSIYCVVFVYYFVDVRKISKVLPGTGMQSTERITLGSKQLCQWLLSMFLISCICICCMT